MILASSIGAGAAVAAVLGAAAAIAALVVLMRRYADAFPLLAVAALPFRLPISADGRTVNLLIPLYLVVAAGVLAHLLPRLFAREERGFGTLEWLLLASIVLYALQALYSSDKAKAAENLAFFYIPFALLFVMLRDVRWTRELLLRCLGVAVALAVVFAGIGFVEYARKELFLNPKVVAANQYDNYFRVNSLFFDPNIYGRFLALVMIAVSAIVLWRRRERDVLLAGAVLLWLLAGLVTSFSQSSIAALLLGLALLAAYRWDTLVTAYVSVSLVVLALRRRAARAGEPALRAEGLGRLDAERDERPHEADRRRPRAVRETAARGLRLGLVPEALRRTLEDGARRTRRRRRTRSRSRSPPSRGSSAWRSYVALLVVAFLTLFRGAGRSPPRMAIAACFAALVLHTWAYADFLEDPLTWTLLGIGLALARGGLSQERDAHELATPAGAEAALARE